jgi:hypothetical protein
MIQKKRNMKTRILTLIICCSAFFTACEKDGALIKVSGLEPSEFMSSENSLVLTKEMASSSVLALTWNKSTLTISDPSMKVPVSVPNQIMEVSSASDFATFTTITPQNTTYAFTGAALNTLAKNLGFTAGVSTPMYFRMNMAYGDNMEPVYSNVITVNVACYTIDMSVAFILNADHEDTGFTLYSPTSNGLYSGFTGVTAWYNWYLREGDETIWGNLGIDGNEFEASSDQSSHWNFWYPGLGGCYYTTLNTASKEWTATNIPTLLIRNGFEADMTFDRTTVQWSASFTTTAPNTTFKVQAIDARLYNRTTGTDDASAIARTIGFVPHADSTLTIEWDSTAAGFITIPEAGDYTLILSLADPKKWTYRVKSGFVIPEEPISEFLYLPGIDDGLPGGSWTFNNYLKLVNEDDSTFAGAVNVNSLWGYQMGLIKDDWENVYKMGSTAGTLAFKGASNITPPAAGLYLIQADLQNLTYSHTSITSLSYAGLNDNWTLAAMDATTIPGVYTSTVNIASVSPWGCKLYLNGGWDYFYGGANGVLQFGGPGIVDDATIGIGTYDLVANIRNAASYVFLGNNVYITGLNDVWDFTSAVLTKSSIGVYTGTVTITKTSSYGITIQLDQSWNRYFGGSLTNLVYKGANITGDQSLANGTYNVTVDFIHNTCTFAVK